MDILEIDRVIHPSANLFTSLVKHLLVLNNKYFDIVYFDIELLGIPEKYGRGENTL